MPRVSAALRALAYPRTRRIGGAKVRFRLMTTVDRDAVLAFARALPAEDLLFLRMDITRDEGVDEWCRNILARRHHRRCSRSRTAKSSATAACTTTTCCGPRTSANPHPGGRTRAGSGVGRALADEMFSLGRHLKLDRLFVADDARAGGGAGAVRGVRLPHRSAAGRLGEDPRRTAARPADPLPRRGRPACRDRTGVPRARPLPAPPVARSTPRSSTSTRPKGPLNIGGISVFDGPLSRDVARRAAARAHHRHPTLPAAHRRRAARHRPPVLGRRPALRRGAPRRRGAVAGARRRRHAQARRGGPARRHAAARPAALAALRGARPARAVGPRWCRRSTTPWWTASRASSCSTCCST